MIVGCARAPKAILLRTSGHSRSYATTARSTAEVAVRLGAPTGGPGADLGHYGSRSRYFLRAGIAWMNHLFAVLEGEYHRLQQAGSGVEAQAQLSVGRAVLVEGLDPQRPLCCLDRILRRDAVLERASVDLHAAKWASAARIASDLLMSFLAAAASRASSSSAVSRTATTCIGSAPRPGRPRPRRLRMSTSYPASASSAHC